MSDTIEQKEVQRRIMLALEALVKIKSAEFAILRAEHEAEYHDSIKCSFDGVEFAGGDEPEDNEDSRTPPRYK